MEYIGFFNNNNFHIFWGGEGPWMKKKLFLSFFILSTVRLETNYHDYYYYENIECDVNEIKKQQKKT